MTNRPPQPERPAAGVQTVRAGLRCRPLYPAFARTDRGRTADASSTRATPQPSPITTLAIWAATTAALMPRARDHPGAPATARTRNGSVSRTASAVAQAAVGYGWTIAWPSNAPAKTGSSSACLGRCEDVRRGLPEGYIVVYRSRPEPGETEQLVVKDIIDLVPRLKHRFREAKYDTRPLCPPCVQLLSSGMMSCIVTGVATLRAIGVPEQAPGTFGLPLGQSVG